MLLILLLSCHPENSPDASTSRTGAVAVVTLKQKEINDLLTNRKSLIPYKTAVKLSLSIALQDDDCKFPQSEEDDDGQLLYLLTKSLALNETQSEQMFLICTLRLLDVTKIRAVLNSLIKVINTAMLNCGVRQ